MATMGTYLATYTIVGMVLAIVLLLATYALMSDDVEDIDKGELYRWLKQTPKIFLATVFCWPVVLAMSFAFILSK
jgi:hypothetical protein